MKWLWKQGERGKSLWQVMRGYFLLIRNDSLDVTVCNFRGVLPKSRFFLQSGLFRERAWLSYQEHSIIRCIHMEAKASQMKLLAFCFFVFWIISHWERCLSPSNSDSLKGQENALFGAKSLTWLSLTWRLISVLKCFAFNCSHRICLEKKKITFLTQLSGVKFF